MSHLLDLSKYCLYRLSTENHRFVAVPLKYEEEIKKQLQEFGSMKDIPISKTVRGIFLKKNNSGQLELLTAPEQENDITMNQLEKAD
jgi:hypothetical protein